MSNPFRSSLSLAVLGCLAMVPASRAIDLPAQTAIPVRFSHTESSAKAKPGDVITAKTMQVVLLPNGQLLPKGSWVIGHVVEARPFKFDDTPYAVQQASYLVIQLDRVVDKSGASSPVVASVRALANPLEVQDALTPQRLDEPDSLGTVEMIGGAHYSPLDRHVLAGPEEDVVAYNKKQGVFARLLPGTYQDGIQCSGTQTEQSVGIFSPDACGLYGFVSEHLSEEKASTFRLTSTHHTVTLYGGTAALLQVQ